jgi:hypothetical protein
VQATSSGLMCLLSAIAAMHATPLQRYKLLLETMLRYTKDMDPLHHRLSENLAQMAVIAETINADVHKMERRNKVNYCSKPLETVSNYRLYMRRIAHSKCYWLRRSSQCPCLLGFQLQCDSVIDTISSSRAAAQY